MTDQETIDKAEALLPVNLRYLMNEIDLYCDTTEEFVYNNLLSTIYHRVGECEAQAEACDNTHVQMLLDNVAHMLERLRNEFEYAQESLRTIVESIDRYLNQPKPKATVQMKEYKEK